MEIIPNSFLKLEKLSARKKLLLQGKVAKKLPSNLWTSLIRKWKFPSGILYIYYRPNQEQLQNMQL